MANVMPMLETSGGDVVTRLFTGAVRWTVPGQTLLFAPGHEFFPLLCRELAPKIGRSGHGLVFTL